MKYPIWKPLLIVVVLALFAAVGYLKGLKPGLDLAGGTTLIYDVKVPEGVDAKRAIDDTISILRNRVDPTGTRNLIWRQIAGNRIEIQMALATADTAERRHDFIEVRDRLLAGNITERQLDAALQADPGKREEAMISLAGGNELLREQLTELGRRYDALVKATEPYREAQQVYDKAEDALKELPELPEDDQAEADEVDEELKQKRAELQEQVDSLLDTLLERTQVYREARNAYEAAREEVLDWNIDPDALQVIFDQPKEPAAEGESSPRQQKLAELKGEHPGRAAQIDEVVQAYEQYEEVKGPLDDPNDLIALLRGSGVLEFRIAATVDNPAVDAEAYRRQLAESGPRAGRDKPWRWFEIDDVTEYISEPEIRAQLPEDPEGILASTYGVVGDAYAGGYYILLGNTTQNSITRANQDWELSSVTRGRDNLGRNAIDFKMNAVGGALMGQVTGAHVGKPMAILLDNRVISSPNIKTKIRGSGQITGGAGGFSEDEMDYMLRTLKAGAVEGQLGDYPISIKTTGPQLGQDHLEAGLNAAIYSLVAVAVFMMCYYFFAGMIADFALVANMVIILGVMSLIEATFTLPGIAGIILTIGMAVDANVLIFERIREEMERKPDLSLAVRLGFEKAFSTIIDANLTTLITCIVLGYTATAEVKGFAVTLGIGILATLFTSLFCTRVIIDLYQILFKARTLNMLPSVVEPVRQLLSPQVDWIGKRFFFFTVSGILMICGVVLVYERGVDMLDIEFRSGTSVSFELAEGETLAIDEVRSRFQAFGEVGEKMTQPGFDPSELTQRETDIYEKLKPIVEHAQERYQQAMSDYESISEHGRQFEEKPQSVDYSLLKEVRPVTEGRIEEGMRAGAFSIATLITDSQTVSAVVKAAFEEKLDTTRPLEFAWMEEDNFLNAPVDKVRSGKLGENINRPMLETDVMDYIGGVAIKIEQIQPPTTVADIRERIRRMRQQPAYEELGYRQSTVIGMDLHHTGPQGKQYFSSVVVLTRDNETNYADNPDAFNDSGGLADTEWSLVRDALQHDTSLASVANFSSQVSNTMKARAISALGMSLLAVVIYIWFRFGSLRYGLAAIVALVHDVTIALGLVALSGWLYDNAIGQAILLDPFKIDLAMVAACLTIVGYSLNDTIVVFDRIRENRGRLAHATSAIINESINQTISRTVLTSGTTLLAVLVLFIFGGSGVHGFAFAMIIGVLVGTYSSIAIASPVLMLGSGTKGPTDQSPSTARKSGKDKYAEMAANG